jgi:hypothetical protein
MAVMTVDTWPFAPKRRREVFDLRPIRGGMAKAPDPSAKSANGGETVVKLSNVEHRRIRFPEH